MPRIPATLLTLAAGLVLVVACAAPQTSPSPAGTRAPSATAPQATGSPSATAGEPSPAATTGETAGPSESASPAASASPIVEPSMLDPELQVETSVAGLDQPTAIALLGPDDYLVTEKATGMVHRVQAGQLSAGPVLDLAVNSFDERGLLGIELHPDFASNGYVYLYWTARDDSAAPDSLLGEDTDVATEVPELGNRVDRFTWDGTALTWESEIVTLRSNTLETDTSGRVRGNHDAGPMEFGPDGKLYVQNGDQNLRGQLQNIQTGAVPDDANLTGIILRLNDDGSIPDDNPFFDIGAEMGDDVGENLQMIWAYGIRNSFGLQFHPVTGDLWQTENGDDSWDEINRFEPGANSGWIQVMGPPERFEEYRQLETESTDGLDNPDFPPDQLGATVDDAMAAMFELEGSAYSAPVFSWRYPPAVTAIEFVPDDSLGASSANSAFLGTVLTDSLLRYPLAEDGTGLALEGGLADNVDDNSAKGDIGESEPYVVGTGFGVVTDIALDPDGLLYVVSLSNGRVYAITLGDGAAPASPPASPAETAAPTGSPAGSPSGVVELTIGTDTGNDLQFVPEEAEVPTGAQVSLTFENVSEAPHNLTFGPPINAMTSTIVQPGSSETIEFTAPEPGDYQFVCTLHPGMDGTLHVTD